MHVYCVPRDVHVKRPDIVKDILMFALWTMESEKMEQYLLIGCHKIPFMDKLNVQVYCKNIHFLKYTN